MGNFFRIRQGLGLDRRGMCATDTVGALIPTALTETSLRKIFTFLCGNVLLSFDILCYPFYCFLQ